MLHMVKIIQIFKQMRFTHPAVIQSMVNVHGVKIICPPPWINLDPGAQDNWSNVVKEIEQKRVVKTLADKTRTAVCKREIGDSRYVHFYFIVRLSCSNYLQKWHEQSRH